MFCRRLRVGGSPLRSRREPGKRRQGDALSLAPGDPEKPPQSIAVAEGAIDAHLGHGDELGGCPAGCQADAAFCDDGDLCTFDECNAAGECENTPVDCDDSNCSTEDSCTPANGCLNRTFTCQGDDVPPNPECCPPTED
jgi:hypothetical protein